MKKILLSAAALAVFMSATPAGAMSAVNNQSAVAQQATVDRAKALNELCRLANDLRNCFYKKTKTDLYNAAKSDGLFSEDETNLKLIEDYVDNKVGPFSSGPAMKGLKNSIEYFETQKKGKDTSGLKNELTTNKYAVIKVLNLVMGKLHANATTTIKVMQRINDIARDMYAYARAINVDQEVLGYITEIFNASHVSSTSDSSSSSNDAFAQSSGLSVTANAGVIPGSTISYTSPTATTPILVGSPVNQTSSSVPTASSPVLLTNGQTPTQTTATDSTDTTSSSSKTKRRRKK